MSKLPISQLDISKSTGRNIHSPILCADLENLNMDKTKFLSLFKDSFKEMPWDLYDVKRKQWEALNQPAEKFEVFKSYYLDYNSSQNEFLNHFNLDKELFEKLISINPWRRRSVCSFEVEFFENQLSIKRELNKGFTQNLSENDIRSLPRTFEQTNTELVDNLTFYSFIKRIANYAQKVTPHIGIKKLEITAHFMSVKARPEIPGNNSPEGAHEDGADFIVSAMVINRQNIIGGKSQVIEKLPSGEMDIIFERELREGEFLFQADTGEEKHYGNDLWHYITPFHIKDIDKEAWRDIVGLDLVIKEPKI